MGADGGLHLVGVVEALDVGEVADVQSGDVVGQGQGEVGEAAILRDVRARGLVSDQDEGSSTAIRSTAY